MEDIAGTGKMLRRTYAQEMAYLTRLTPTQWMVKPGFVPNMRVPGVFYVNQRLETLLFDELSQYCDRGDHGGFLPAVSYQATSTLPASLATAVASGTGGVMPPPHPIP